MRPARSANCTKKNADWPVESQRAQEESSNVKSSTADADSEKRASQAKHI